MEDLLAALAKSRILRFVDGEWQLEGFSLENEGVDELWPEIERALEAEPALADHVTTVVFHDDGWYESAHFLSFFRKLEELVLYGNTLLSDLSGLAGHPGLGRVAFTNYCCIAPNTGGLDWLNELPELEELVFFERYLAFGGWTPSPRMLGQLRSLWMNWSDFQKIPHAALTQLEQLTLYFLDTSKLNALINFATNEDHKDEGLIPDFFSLERGEGLKLRMLFDVKETQELREQIDALLARWLPSGANTTIEYYWKGQVMPLLNDGYGFIKRN